MSASGPQDGRADEWVPTAPSSDGPASGYDAHRNPPRDWAAPPPWATGAGLGAGAGPGAGSPRPGAADGRPAIPDFLGASADDGRGLAGSPADRLATGGRGLPHDAPSSGPDPDLASLVAGTAAAHHAGERVADEWLAAERAAERSVEEAEYGRATTDFPRSTRTGRRRAVSSTRPDRERDRDRDRERLPAHEHVQTQDGPSWERARRYEAYPAIKARASAAGLPRAAVLAGALAIAALALFFLPALLGIIGGGGAKDPAPSSSPSASAPLASLSAAPSIAPVPAGQTYVIKAGDTLSKVAAEFGLTVDQLLEANPTTIVDADSIKVGDEIIIPAQPPDEVGGSVEPSSGTSPATSPAP